MVYNIFMDIGDTEKEGYFLGKLLKPTQKGEMVPVASQPSDFEKELFRSGVYEFNFDKEVQKSEADYRRDGAWLHQARWAPDRAKETLASFASSESCDLAWKQAFSGVIPIHWNIWYIVEDSFNEGGKRNVQLSPTLINAGISNDNHLVVNEVGKSQKLSPQQLGFILGRDDIPSWNSDQIVEAQERKGMTRSEYDEARVFAAEVREMIRKARSKKKQISTPKPQLGKKSQRGEA